MVRSPLRTLAARVRSGGTTASALARESLSRIERLDPALRAVVTLCPDQALDRARELDHGAGGACLPLFGLPILVKDNQDVAGVRTSHGSALFDEAPVARATERGPALLEAAGAVIVGKTNLPELASEGYTANPRFGATANPWNTKWNAGGSSGGSAAALVSGLCAAVTGTDGGGSIRIPAAFCGLLGLKPTLGGLGRSPVPAWMDMSTDGILAQTADDLALLYSLLAGPAEGDFTAGMGGSDVSRVVRDPRTTRLLPVRRFVGATSLPEAIETAFVGALEALSETLDAPVAQPPALPLATTGNPDCDWFVLSTTEQAWALGEELLARRGAEMDPVIHRYLQQGLRTTTGDYIAARRRRYSYSAVLDRQLAEGAVLVSPTVTVEGLGIAGSMPGRDRAGTRLGAFNTMLPNLTGHPAISLPAGVLPNGLPFGLQLIARRGEDEFLIALARAWERARPWPLTAPGFEPFE